MHKTNCMQSIKTISIWEVFSSICPETCVLGTLKNRLIETVVLSTQNIRFG